MSCTTLGRSACFAALTLALTAACASTSTTGGALRFDQAAGSRHLDEFSVETHMQTLTDSELAATGAFSTSDAVRRLRPQFLTGSTRQPTLGPPEIAVYLNTVYAGEVSTLSTIPLSEITRITFLHPMEARSHFGIMCRCANGALLVFTRRATMLP
jgi:hypothetical protein